MPSATNTNLEEIAMIPVRLMELFTGSALGGRTTTIPLSTPRSGSTVPIPTGGTKPPAGGLGGRTGGPEGVIPPKQTAPGGKPRQPTQAPPKKRISGPGRFK